MAPTTHVNFLSVIIPFAWLRISAIPPYCVAFSPIVVVIVSPSFQTNHGSSDERICTFALTFSIASLERECVTPTLVSRIHFAKRRHPTFSLNFRETDLGLMLFPKFSLSSFPLYFPCITSKRKVCEDRSFAMRHDGCTLDDLRTFRINIF